MPTHNHTGTHVAKLNIKNNMSRTVGSACSSEKDRQVTMGETDPVLSRYIDDTEDHHREVIRSREIDPNQEA